MRQIAVFTGGVILLAAAWVALGPVFSGDDLCGVDAACRGFLETPAARELANRLGEPGHTRSMALLGLQSLALPPVYPRNPLSQFVARGERPCLDCHDARALAGWWSLDRSAAASGPESVLFPLLDFWQRLRFALATHPDYEAQLPNRSNRVLTAIGTLASLAAAGEPVRLSGGVPADTSDATPECTASFRRLGSPEGAIGPYVVEGCNLVTRKASPNAWARFPAATLWLYGPVQIECGSCHTHAGGKPLLGHLGYAAQAWPVYMRSFGTVLRLEERFEPCAMQSMGLGFQGADSPALAAIGAYALWLAQREGITGRLRGPGEADLRGVPLVRTTAAASEGDSFTAGREKYRRYCEVCHGPGGLGRPGLEVAGAPAPPLLGKGIYTAAASTAVPERLAGIILHAMPYSPDPQTSFSWDGDPETPTQIAAYLSTLGMMRADGRSPPVVQLARRLQLALFGDLLTYGLKSPEERDRLHLALAAVILGPLLYALARLSVRRRRTAPAGTP